MLVFACSSSSGYTHDEGWIWAVVTVQKSKNGVKEKHICCSRLETWLGLRLTRACLGPVCEWLKVLIVCLPVFFLVCVLIKCLCFCYIWVGWQWGQMFSLILFLHKRHIIMYLIIKLGYESPFQNSSLYMLRWVVILRCGQRYWWRNKGPFKSFRLLPYRNKAQRNAFECVVYVVVICASAETHVKWTSVFRWFVFWVSLLVVHCLNKHVALAERLQCQMPTDEMY